MIGSGAGGKEEQAGPAPSLGYSPTHNPAQPCLILPTSGSSCPALPRLVKTDLSWKGELNLESDACLLAMNRGIDMAQQLSHPTQPQSLRTNSGRGNWQRKRGIGYANGPGLRQKGVNGAPQC
ncbi:unnamed protein product [Tetraodon nigroviridis]|uniref:(spotted green pufferfish) hypothetical protein n=1 Tax=Tetraodon nigroviridis TaxID=99883 RepID=Q4S6I7_TETNG|nr:unnamed protein product [Tetraodon nigroviridis]